VYHDFINITISYSGRNGRHADPDSAAVSFLQGLLLNDRSRGNGPLFQGTGRGEMGRLFGTDGIRGRANTYPIVPEFALRLGKAIAEVFASEDPGGKLALIGKDTRLSGYMLETALTSGLVSMGMDVLLVGPSPTAGVAHLTRTMNASVGIMLTASHNPYDDNGIKIFDRDGFKLSDEIENRIEELALSGGMNTEQIGSAKLGKAERIDDVRNHYFEFTKTAIGDLNLKGLKIVLDCANGAAYDIGPWIFRELGAEVITIGVEPDGLNINHLCGALHPDHVGRFVSSHRADAGIALDGDADRVIFTDASGRVVDGDRILAMCALDLKQRRKLCHNTLVTTVMSNLGLQRAMNSSGIRVITTTVGDRNVIEQMKRGGYNLGGEKSGHLIFMDHATTGDGIISALQVLRLMQEKGRPLAELADCMEELPQRLANIEVREKRPLDEFPRLCAAIQEGKGALGERGRILVRYSGTESKIRILVEAEDAAAVDHWIDMLAGIAREEMGM